MIGLVLVLLILVYLGVHWGWSIHAGPLFVSLNDSVWDRPFTCDHGPKRLPWWQYAKVMPWRCDPASAPCWNVFVYTRRGTRCHFVAWRPRERRSWRLYWRTLR